MRRVVLKPAPKRTLLDVDTATSEQVFNELAKFMISNPKGRNSVNRNEAAKFLNCTTNKATRLIKSFVGEGKLRKDSDVDDLYWLVIE